LKKHWCIGRVNGTFIWHMEEVLDIYERPYNPLQPVICFDERPCQLISDVVAPIPMKQGRVQRQDCHYKRNGVCCILTALEPLAGTRFIEVTKQRTKKDYALFMQQLERKYPDAEMIILVQDNLNTHDPSSFYETFSAETAFRLSQRFHMLYTPKRASWLNMAEIELSALSKQCLDRRIGDMMMLSKEVQAWADDRNQRKATVNWQFTKNDARTKLARHYKGIKN
jgi:hypothetical protein